MITYAAIKNNTVVNVLAFDDNVQQTTIDSFKESLGFDELVVSVGNMVMGATKVKGNWVTPSPWPSWVLNKDYQWEAPVKMPTTGGPWKWDEGSLSWYLSI